MLISCGILIRLVMKTLFTTSICFQPHHYGKPHTPSKINMPKTVNYVVVCIWRPQTIYIESAMMTRSITKFKTSAVCIWHWYWYNALVQRFYSMNDILMCMRIKLKKRKGKRCKYLLIVHAMNRIKHKPIQQISSSRYHRLGSVDVAEKVIQVNHWPKETLCSLKRGWVSPPFRFWGQAQTRKLRTLTKIWPLHAAWPELSRRL